MTPEQTAVARRLVESPHWRWVEGAKDAGGARCTKARSGSVKWAVDDWLSDWCELEGDEAPDLNDPATIGVIEHLAREAWAPNEYEHRLKGCDRVQADCHKPWRVWTNRGKPIAYGVCRGEAWAAALLAAP